MKATAMKFGAFMLLIGLWILLDEIHLNDAALIETIRYAIAGLGLWHGIVNLQTVPPAAPPTEPPQAPAARALPTVPLE
jgi:hypothetical protein